jgi:hypothetical protein
MAIVTAKNRAALSRIREIAGNIEGLPKPTMRAVSEAMGKRVRGLISEGFDERRAPDGKAWKKREQQKPWSLLEKTGKMRRGWRVIVSAKGMKTTNRFPHTKFHQDGTRNMVARPMVPRKGQRLPEKWRVSILRSAKNAVGKELKKVLAP